MFLGLSSSRRGVKSCYKYAGASFKILTFLQFIGELTAQTLHKVFFSNRFIVQFFFVWGRV